jgi:hypothetical protein
MKSRIQILLVLCVFAICTTANAQDEKTVTLVVSGQGITQDEAKQNALRSAIEQAFGTFISSKTEILNDDLVKDEIVSVSNGNIQKFEVISEVQIPNGDYATTLKAIVSVTRLTSFCESKGVVVEFKGGLFASNILIQELYEKNESVAIENLISTLKGISKKSFDYSIDAADPFSNNGNWNIPITVSVMANNNFTNIPTLLEQTIKNLTLSASELDNYIKLKKSVFPLTLATNDNKGIYYLRNENSITLVVDFIYSLNSAISNFAISNGIDVFSLDKYNIGSKYSRDCNCSISNLEIFDNNFRIILKNRNDGGWCGICAASLFHNFCGSRHDSKIPNFNYKEVYSDGMDYSIEYKDCFGFTDKKNKFGFVKTLLNNKIEGPLGLVISFATIKSNSLVVVFQFNDLRTIEEIKKITKYEITPNR